MSYSKQFIKKAQKTKGMPGWIKAIWLLNAMILFYGRDRPTNGRPR